MQILNETVPPAVDAPLHHLNGSAALLGVELYHSQLNIALERQGPAARVVVHQLGRGKNIYLI